MPPVPKWVTSTEKPFGKLTSIESEGPLTLVLVEGLPTPASVAPTAEAFVRRDSVGQFKGLPLLILLMLIQEPQNSDDHRAGNPCASGNHVLNHWVRQT